MRRSGFSLKEILYLAIFIAVVLQLIAFLVGSPNMPEVLDAAR